MDDERREIAKRVMKAMRYEGVRRGLVNDQVVICVGSDTVNDAARRVAGVGGLATVVVPHGQHLVPLTWKIRPGEDALVVVDQKVHPDSTLSMVLDLMEAAGVKGITVHIEAGEAAVTEGDTILVPA